MRSDLNYLLTARISDGGWGLDSENESGTIDAAIALQAPKAANYSDAAVLYQAVNYLSHHQSEHRQRMVTRLIQSYTESGISSAGQILTDRSEYVKEIFVCAQYSFFVSLIIYNLAKALPAEKNAFNTEKPNEMQAPLNKLIKIIENKQYEAVRHYARKDQLYWIECGPTDGEAFKYSSGHLIKMLSRYSRNASIYVNGKPDVVDLEGRGETFTVVIRTEGWTGEYHF